MATATPTRTGTYPTEPHSAASTATPRTSPPTTTRTEKGMSFARGPALILGTIVLAVGLYLLYKARTFPPFSNFPNGGAAKDGDFLFGLFGANGWTGMLTAAGGGLLLFGAAQHLLAKTMSLIVGVAFGAAAVIALVNGNVLGMAAANGWTKLGWAVCAVILLFNTLAPRRRREVVAEDADARDAPVAYRRRPTADDRHAVADDRPVTAQDGAVHHDAEQPTVLRDEAPTTVHHGDEEPTTVHHGGEEPTAVRDDATEPSADHRDQPADFRRDEVATRSGEPRRD